MNIRVYALSMLSCCLCLALHGQNDPVETKAKLTKWVETRQLIAEEVNEWEVEKEFLTATRDLLQEQAKSLNEKIGELQANTTQADKVRSDLAVERGNLQRANEGLETQIASMETQIKELIKLFPEPLKKKLDKLIVRIPEDPSKSSLSIGQRLITVLGILSQAEKFNSSPSIEKETRKVGNDEILVSTIYWGFAFAVFVDTNGKIAGVGHPGSDGWVWEERNDLATEIKGFVDMYEGNVDVIEFVQLPISIK